MFPLGVSQLYLPARRELRRGPEILYISAISLIHPIYHLRSRHLAASAALYTPRHSPQSPIDSEVVRNEKISILEYITDIDTMQYVER